MNLASTLITDCPHRPRCQPRTKDSSNIARLTHPRGVLGGCGIKEGTRKKAQPVQEKSIKFFFVLLFFFLMEGTLLYIVPPSIRKVTHTSSFPLSSTTAARQAGLQIKQQLQLKKKKTGGGIKMEKVLSF